MKYMVRRFFIIITFVILGLGAGKPVFAQNLPSLGGVAVNVEVADSQASTGDILSIGKDGLKRTDTAYDVQMYGVISSAPILSVEPKTDKTKALVSSGVTDVNVSAANGAIEVGDYITSSETAGVGQKATNSGYILGKALAKYDDNSKAGTISVDINIGYSQVGAAGVGRAGLDNLANALANILQNTDQFPTLLRYIIAFLIAVFTFIGSTFSFIKFISAGIVAIGRNPLAKGTIIGGMILAGIVVSILTISGFAIAAVILGVGKIWPR